MSFLSKFGISPKREAELDAAVQACAPGCQLLSIEPSAEEIAYHAEFPEERRGDRMTPELLAAANSTLLKDAVAAVRRLHDKRATAPTNWQMALMLLPAVFILRACKCDDEDVCRAVADTMLSRCRTKKLTPERLDAVLTLARQALQAAIQHLAQREYISEETILSLPVAQSIDPDRASICFSPVFGPKPLAGWYVLAQPAIVISRPLVLLCVQLYNAASMDDRVPKVEGRACLPVLNIRTFGELAEYEDGLCYHMLRSKDYACGFLAVFTRRGASDSLSFHYESTSKAMRSLVDALVEGWPQKEAPDGGAGGARAAAARDSDDKSDEE